MKKRVVVFTVVAMFFLSVSSAWAVEKLVESVARGHAEAQTAISIFYEDGQAGCCGFFLVHNGGGPGGAFCS